MTIDRGPVLSAPTKESQNVETYPLTNTVTVSWTQGACGKRITSSPEVESAATDPVGAEETAGCGTARASRRATVGTPWRTRPCMIFTDASSPGRTDPASKSRAANDCLASQPRSTTTPCAGRDPPSHS